MCTHVQVTYIEEVRRPSSAGAPLRNAATNRAPMSPTSSNGPMSPMRSTSDFPLRLGPPMYSAILLCIYAEFLSPMKWLVQLSVKKGQLSEI